MCCVLFVYHDNHDNADLSIRTCKRRTVYPPCFAFNNLDVICGDARAIIGYRGLETRVGSGYAGQPGDFCCDADALSKRLNKAVTNMFRAANVVFEFRLAETGDTKGRGCEHYTEGWMRADEDVLAMSVVQIRHGERDVHFDIPLGPVRSIGSRNYLVKCAPLYPQNAFS